MTKKKKASFNCIKYSNCWEDADVLLEFLDIQPTDHVLSVGSAGDNSFSLLSKKPQKMVVVDPNPYQLYLIELKKVCFQTLSHSEFLEFLGFKNSGDRWILYQKIAPHLSVSGKRYWEANRKLIDAGVVFSGKLDRYFLLFANRVVPLIHNKKTVQELFQKKSAKEQLNFYAKKWETWRWKLLFKIFFSKFIMSRLGRDPAYFNEVNKPFSQAIFEQTKKHLNDVNCQHNYILEFILSGHFSSNLPYYARAENFPKIKENINRMELHQCTVQEIKPNEKFHKLNLSNIFEYMNEDDFRKSSVNIVNQLTHSEGKLIYWNLMVERNLTKHMDHVTDLNSSQFAEKDLGFFYGALHCNKKL